MNLQISVSQQLSPRTGWFKGMTLITMGVILILALVIQFPQNDTASRQPAMKAVFQSDSDQRLPRAVPVPTPPYSIPLSVPGEQPRFGVTPQPSASQPRPQPVQTPPAAFGEIKALLPATAGH